MTSVERVGWRHTEERSQETLLGREWLVTNGLGGYASGTVVGVNTRRYHGLLIAALSNPWGRTMMLNQISEQITLSDGSRVRLAAHEQGGQLQLGAADYLREFRLRDGLPVWTFELGPYLIERSLVLPYLQNTVHLSYRLLRGDGALRLSIQPALHFRSHDAPVSAQLGGPYTLVLRGDKFEVSRGSELPSLKMRMLGASATFVFEHLRQSEMHFRTEAERGYDAVGDLWSHGHFKVLLSREQPATLMASTESWETMLALSPAQALEYEQLRRERLVHVARTPEQDAVGAELVLAADQFLIAPAGRYADATRARAQGEELRTVIAGYHWFTDWGRDTMISLEGLTLCTGREQEARWILQTFAHYIRDGLIPNMFPEGAQSGLYHTADATLWFFHALDRYLAHTQDRDTLRQILPKLLEVLDLHVRGTRFGIHVDEGDGLLVQGEPGYQLTWMDAKCDGWVVTPRRGKAVEINALWFNALALAARWVGEERGVEAARPFHERAARVQDSFNARFWSPKGGYLYDVVDGEGGGADDAFRPNQLLAIALPNPVLARERWRAVLEKTAERLLTPRGLRSLSRDHPDYKPNYHGDLRTRDAAYHQGTVWSWLMGPFIDAWLKTYPEDRQRARGFLEGMVAHLGEACIGQVSEVFDAEAPFRPRGCIAQAWGVAELLRAWRATSSAPLP